jgi:hypothetical protein
MKPVRDVCQGHDRTSQVNPYARRPYPPWCGAWRTMPLVSVRPARAVTKAQRFSLGSISVTTRPPSGRLVSWIRPPCASTISRASAKPSPVPACFVE